MSLSDLPPGLVAIPCQEIMWSKCAVALREATLPERLPPGSRVEFDALPVGTVLKRNSFARRVLEDPALQWLLFFDSDMIPPPDAVARLLHQSRDASVIAGLAFDRHEAFRVCAGGVIGDNQCSWLSVAECDGSVREVDWVGMACTLISRDALDNLVNRLNEPAFGIENGRGEDWRFCWRVKHLMPASRILCDTGLIVGHVGLINIDLDLRRRIIDK